MRSNINNSATLTSSRPAMPRLGSTDKRKRQRNAALRSSWRRPGTPPSGGTRPEAEDPDLAGRAAGAVALRAGNPPDIRHPTRPR